MAARRTGAGKQPAGVAGNLSVIVPAYNEVENIRPLCERLFKALGDAGITGEMLVMDDESKGSAATIEIVSALAKEGYPVRIHARKKSEGKGLSSAVLLGFDMAKYEFMCCMDADLQHEPESVPAVAEPVMTGAGDFSVGSRNVDGGGLGFEWSLLRRVISSGATMLCLPLTSSTDPMSGFFCVSKTTLAKGRAKCQPIGFKIGLEVYVRHCLSLSCAPRGGLPVACLTAYARRRWFSPLLEVRRRMFILLSHPCPSPPSTFHPLPSPCTFQARCGCSNVIDVPITFQERVAGESNLTMKQNVEYLQQLASLYWDKFGFLLVVLALVLLAIAFYVLKMLAAAVL